LQEHDKFQHLQKREEPPSYKKAGQEGQWAGSVTVTGTQDEESEVPPGNGETHLHFLEVCIYIAQNTGGCRVGHFEECPE